MSWIGAAIVGGSVLGAGIQAWGANKAAGTQADAMNNATRLQQTMWQQEQANLAPWLTSGRNAMAGLNQFMGVNPDGTVNYNAPGMSQYPTQAFSASPDYQYILGQAQEATQNKASAAGGVFSGNTLSALQENAAGLASSDYNQWLNNWQNYQGNTFGRLNAMSGAGLNAAAGTANLGATTAGQIGNNMVGGANAMAAGQVGVANAFQGGLSSGINNYMGYQQLQGQQQFQQMMMNNMMGGGGYGAGAGGGFSPWMSYAGLGGAQPTF